MESRPSDGPLRLQRSAPPPGHRLHPRYGESAIQISSQCDARTNEFPDFKASGTAKCLPAIVRITPTMHYLIMALRTASNRADNPIMARWLHRDSLAGVEWADDPVPALGRAGTGSFLSLPPVAGCLGCSVGGHDRTAVQAVAEESLVMTAVP